jgi:hypothetical protein
MNLIWYSPLLFLTTWSFIAVMYSNILYKYIDLLFLTTSVLVTSTLIFFVHPRILRFPIAKDRYYEPTLAQKIAYHIVFHVAPFAYIAYFYRNSDTVNVNATANAILLIIIYMCSVNVERVYNIDASYVLLYTVISIIIYIRTFRV